MNKMIYKTVLAIASFVLLASSCMKEIDLEHLRPDPKLVLNGLVLAGDTVRVHLTRTWFYTEDKPDLNIKNPDIKLFVNGVFKEQMTWVEYSEEGLYPSDWYSYDDNLDIRGYYTATYQPAEGERIRITAEAEGFASISAETIVPVKPSLKDIAVHEKKTVTEEYYYTHPPRDIRVIFEDNPGKRDFYIINFEYGFPLHGEGYGKVEYTGEYGWRAYSPDYSSDPLFTSHLSAIDKILGYDWISGEHGRAFSDDLIEGKEYTIKLRSDKYYYSYSSSDYIPDDQRPPDMYRVNLYSITEDYYRYIKAIIEMRDGGGVNEHMSDIGLAEPVRMFSNVEGGVGILGAATRDSITTTVIPQ